MRPIIIVLCALFVSIASIASAEEIQAGTQYTGPKQLGIESIGISFTLPKGFIGALPQGEQTFVIGKQGLNGSILIVAEQATVAEAQSEMSQPVTMAPVTMTPKGQATVKGDRIINDYTVTGGQMPLDGHAIARVGKTGWGVMVLALAPAAELAEFKKVAEAIAASVKIVKPKVPKASNGGHWGKALSGQRIIRFYTGSGYSEKTQIALCPNGQFFYNFNGGGATVNGSGAAVSKNAGTWSVTGGPAAGQLSLRYNDGRTSQYSLSDSDGKLMVDGQRWFREPVNCN